MYCVHETPTFESVVSRRRNTIFGTFSTNILNYRRKVLQKLQTQKLIFANTVKPDVFCTQYYRICTMVCAKCWFCTILSFFFWGDFARVLKSQHRTKRKNTSLTCYLQQLWPGLFQYYSGIISVWKSAGIESSYLSLPLVFAATV